ncbi:MAG: hypothetical protein R3B99_20920 [Polyangiales bacterium]
MVVVFGHRVGDVAGDGPLHDARLDLPEETVERVAKPMGGRPRFQARRRSCFGERFASGARLHEAANPRREHPAVRAWAPPSGQLLAPVMTQDVRQLGRNADSTT